MCLIKKKYNIISKKAKKDIEVFVVRAIKKRHICSPYFNYTWKLNKTYEEKKFKKISFNKYINEGFHSKINSVNDEYEWLSFFKQKYKFGIFKAIIPKGSRYYISYDKTEICSNKLKLVKKLKIKRIFKIKIKGV